MLNVELGHVKLNPVSRGPFLPGLAIYLGQLGKHFGQVLLDGNVNGVIPEVLEMTDDIKLDVAVVTVVIVRSVRE